MANQGITNGWHLKKEISVGHILTTATVAISVIAWGISVENRLTTGEIERKSMSQNSFAERSAIRGLFAQNNQHVSEQLRSLGATLLRIEDKLDRKADKP